MSDSVTFCFYLAEAADCSRRGDFFYAGVWMGQARQYVTHNDALAIRLWEAMFEAVEIAERSTTQAKASKPMRSVRGDCAACSGFPTRPSLCRGGDGSDVLARMQKAGGALREEDLAKTARVGGAVR